MSESGAAPKYEYHGISWPRSFISNSNGWHTARVGFTYMSIIYFEVGTQTSLMSLTPYNTADKLSVGFAILVYFAFWWIMGLILPTVKHIWPNNKPSINWTIISWLNFVIYLSLSGGSIECKVLHNYYSPLGFLCILNSSIHYTCPRFPSVCIITVWDRKLVNGTYS